MLIAQELTIASLLNALKPINLWGWLLYLIIFLDVVTMLLQKQGTLQLTIFLAISILAALINELGANELARTTKMTPGVFTDMLITGRFANWMIIVVMLIFPFVVAGMTKTGRSRLPAILAGIFSIIYLIGRYVTMPK